MKPVTSEVVSKKRVTTPLTAAPVSKCARMAAADEKKAERELKQAQQKEKVAEREVAKEKKELSKAEKLADRERKAEEKKEKSEERAKKKEETEAKKAAKAAHPKKPRSAFFIFCAGVREKIVEENPELKGKTTEVSKVLGARWKEISDEEKKALEAQAEEERLG